VLRLLVERGGFTRVLTLLVATQLLLLLLLLAVLLFGGRPTRGRYLFAHCLLVMLLELPIACLSGCLKGVVIALLVLHVLWCVLVLLWGSLLYRLPAP